MSLSPGMRLGPYEITSLIGAGGMGEVYRARDPRLGRDVAIKVLPSGLSSDPERLQRFEQEARAAASLNHPNILAVHDISQHEGAPFIVSELLEGETLRERLNSGALPVRKAIDFTVQVARGLAAAHEKGIIHRDLKPENLFVTSDGLAKILDFGLAKLTHVESSLAGASALATAPPRTTPGVVLGTIGYMSPEQVRGMVADHRSDIFSFGAILYEMLSGRRAFHRETSADTMTAILKEDPPDWSAAERRVPPMLMRIVDRCLEKNPAGRFQTASDLAFALESLSSGSDFAAAAAIQARGPSRSPRGLRLVWGITAASLLVAALLAWPASLYLRSAAPDPVVTRLDVVTPPTAAAFSFALSPDGRQLAFVANTERGSQLWLRLFDQAAAQPLAGTEDASYPFWAPDGRAIGFFADGKMKRLDLAGGAPQVIADAPVGRGGAWNADGMIVFAPNQIAPLMRVSARGGTPVPLTQLEAGLDSHRWPQFLPDGQRVTFLRAFGPSQGTYVVALDGGEPRRVIAGETAAVYAPPGYLLWVSQGELVAQRFDATRATVTGRPVPIAQAVGRDDGTQRSGFSVSAAGLLAHRAGAVPRRQLVWVDRAGKLVGAIGSPDDSALSMPELAPDGQRVAVGRVTQGNFDVWLMGVSRNVTSRFTFDAAVEGSAVWSPDGNRLVFTSSRKGGFDLFEKPASSATEEQPLLVDGQVKWPIDWSRDGRFILYRVLDAKRSAGELWALPLAGERKPFPLVQSPFDDIGGQFSPDGRWLAYSSNESGQYEIYIRPFSEVGGKWQVSTAGGTQPRWRRDGRELFYVAPDNRLMAVAIRPVANTHALDAGAPVALFPTRLASGANIGAAGSTPFPQYAVAADGRFLMNVATEDAVTSPITIVLNWQAALAKQ